MAQPSEPAAELLARWGIPAGAAVALALSGAAIGPGWPRRAAAVARGGAWGDRLTGAELAALPVTTPADRPRTWS